MADAREFLSPTSVLTPSAAGGLIVTIALPLADGFDLSFKLVALIVSFLLGLLIVLSGREPMTRSVRLLYVVLNSLIIFSVSLGIGISVDSPPPATLSPNTEIKKILEQISTQPVPLARLSPGFKGISSAFAEEPKSSTLSKKSSSDKGSSSQGQKSAQTELTKEQLESLSKYLLQQRELEQKQQKHNKRWSW